jgi:hypothetical protein
VGRGSRAPAHGHRTRQRPPLHRPGAARLLERDTAALYALGAHPFLLLTIVIPVHERQFTDFLSFAHDFRDKVAHPGHPDFRT